MRFLRVFETEQERQAVVSQLAYNTMSLVDGVLLLQDAVIPANDHYIGTINAEYQDSYKILAGGDSGGWEWHPARVVVDGVELEQLSDWIVLTPGLHTIEIWDDPENSGYYTMHGTGGYFESCNYSSMIIPDYVTEMGKNVLYSNPLVSVTIGNSVTTIGESAFFSCDFTSVTIPDSVTSIGQYAFTYCDSLTSVTIPNSVVSIGMGAFSDCSGLTSVTIPDSVTNIGEGAFANCSGLTSITCNAINPPALGSIVFNDTNDCPIYVPASSVDAYKAATGWSDYASRIQAIQS